MPLIIMDSHNNRLLSCGLNLFVSCTCALLQLSRKYKESLASSCSNLLQSSSFNRQEIFLKYFLIYLVILNNSFNKILRLLLKLNPKISNSSSS